MEVWADFNFQKALLLYYQEDYFYFLFLSFCEKEANKNENRNKQENQKHFAMTP
jgi:hypothetical protein